VAEARKDAHNDALNEALIEMERWVAEERTEMGQRWSAQGTQC
jgi:hypothetical protein